MSRSVTPETNTQRKATKWCYTVNDNARAWAEGQMEYVYNNESDKIRYICGQLEVAPDTGRLHFQGYLQLKTSQRLSWVKAHVHATAHFEVQKASNNDDARNYCNKEDTRMEGAEFVEFGSYVKGAGARTDLTTIRDAIKEGATHRQLMEDYCNTYARHIRFCDRATAYYQPTRPEVTVKLYIGEPGTGKTRLATSDPDHYVVPIGDKLWMDGYDGQTTIVLDDFSGRMSHMQLCDTLRLLDRYPIRVPIKGGFTWITAPTVIVTTNIHPFRWYKWETRANQYEALWRRFNEVLYFPKDSEPEEQPLPGFFYDEDLIWPDEETLYQPLPVCNKPWLYPEDCNIGVPGNQ